MRCNRVQSLYDDYSRGTIRPAVLTRIDEHLSTCSQCRAIYESNDLLAQMVRYTGEVAHPGADYFDGLSDKVLSALKQQPPILISDPARPFEASGRNGWFAFSNWVGIAAAFALILLCAIPDTTSQQTRYLHSKETTFKFKQHFTESNRLLTGMPHFLNPKLVNYFDEMPLRFSDVTQASSLLVQAPSVTPTTNAQSKEYQAASNPEIRTVSMLTPSANFPEEMILKIEQQLLLNAEPAILTASLHQLEKIVAERSTSLSYFDPPPFIKQLRLFIEAEEAANKNLTNDAFKLYSRVRYADEQALISLRATLRLAEILYSDLKSFQKAYEEFSRCHSAETSGAFSPSEIKFIERRLAILERYRTEDWRALILCANLDQPSWTESIDDLNELLGLEHTTELLPEVVRKLYDRMLHTPPQDLTTVSAIYTLLVNYVDSMESSDIAIQLNLSLGDIALEVMQNPSEAASRYTYAVKASANEETADVSSVSVGLARKKLNEVTKLLNTVTP